MMGMRRVHLNVPMVGTARCAVTARKAGGTVRMRRDCEGAGCAAARGADSAARRSCHRGFIALILVVALVLPVRAQEPAAWQAKRAPVMTRWAADVSPTNDLPEYPRPQLVRPDWMNLNGLWDYSITSDSADQPTSYTEKILFHSRWNPRFQAS